jgi:hypothetical protein
VGGWMSMPTQEVLVNEDANLIKSVSSTINPHPNAISFSYYLQFQLRYLCRLQMPS